MGERLLSGYIGQHRFIESYVTKWGMNGRNKFGLTSNMHNKTSHQRRIKNDSITGD